MRLLSSIFLSVGVALFAVVLLVTTQSPLWLTSILVPLCVFRGILVVTWKEDGVSLSFAAAGILFSIGENLTSIIGTVLAVIGTVRFLEVIDDEEFALDRKSLPLWAAWILSIAASVLVPYVITKLSFAMFSSSNANFLPGVCGLAFCLAGFLVRYLEILAEAKRSPAKK